MSSSRGITLRNGVLMLAGTARTVSLLTAIYLLGSSSVARAQIAGADVASALQVAPSARVVVALVAPAGAGASASSLRAGVDRVQDQVLAGVSSADFEMLQRYEMVPGLVGHVTAQGLAALLADPRVARVDLDVPLSASLAETVPIIAADVVQGVYGLSGTGVTVAVIDTGIDSDHPDLAGRLVAEQCFCSVGLGCCPNGSVQQVGPGSAEDDEFHGTHVTGIVAGNGTVAPVGVAPGAGIVAVKVLDSTGGGMTSDLIAGLDWILNTRPDVDAVNASLGAGSFPGDCDGATSFTMMTGSLIDMLFAAGVPVFAASGNRFQPDEMSAPACVQQAVSVGATADDDSVAGFSNGGATLDLLAPGVSVDAAGIGGGTRTLSGTSMASPHAAGAFALLREAFPTTATSDILDALASTGTPITDPKNGLSQPRIDVQAAYTSLLDGPPGDCFDNVNTILGDDTDNSFANGTALVGSFTVAVDDRICGFDGRDSMQGGLGNDFLRAGPGDDPDVGGTEVVSGNDGDDFINGNEGNDFLRGGMGNDTIRGGMDDDTILGELGDDVILGDLGDDVLLSGGDGADRISGGDGADFLNGNAGPDFANGNAGDDVVRGGSEDDVVRGGRGCDELHGDEGNDQLWGDKNDGCPGVDMLFGGLGDDDYFYRPGDGDDVIDDADGSNRLFLREIADVDFSQTADGNDTLVTIHAGGSIRILNNELRGNFSILNPSIRITKSPANQLVPSGGTANFMVTVENTGGTSLADVTVSEAPELSPDCARSLGTLAAFASTSYGCSVSGVVADFDNSAIVTATPPLGADVTALDTVSVSVGGTCGDGGVDPGEECDDGGNMDGDGCSSSCEEEDFVSLFGVAAGGSVAVTVDGVTLVSVTQPGEGAAQVLDDLVAAINGDPTLTQLGVAASVLNGILVTNGAVSSVVIADAGLSRTAPHAQVEEWGASWSLFSDKFSDDMFFDGGPGEPVHYVNLCGSTTDADESGGVLELNDPQDDCPLTGLSSTVVFSFAVPSEETMRVTFQLPPPPFAGQFFGIGLVERHDTVVPNPEFVNLLLLNDGFPTPNYTLRVNVTGLDVVTQPLGIPAVDGADAIEFVLSLALDAASNQLTPTAQYRLCQVSPCEPETTTGLTDLPLPPSATLPSGIEHISQIFSTKGVGAGTVPYLVEEWSLEAASNDDFEDATFGAEVPYVLAVGDEDDLQQADGKLSIRNPGPVGLNLGLDGAMPGPLETTALYEWAPPPRCGTFGIALGTVLPPLDFLTLSLVRAADLDDPMGNPDTLQVWLQSESETGQPNDFPILQRATISTDPDNDPGLAGVTELELHLAAVEGVQPGLVPDVGYRLCTVAGCQGPFLQLAPHSAAASPAAPICTGVFAFQFDPPTLDAGQVAEARQLGASLIAIPEPGSGLLGAAALAVLTLLALGRSRRGSPAGC